MPREPGDRVDRYVLEEWIGAGASADVYRAYDPKLARRVAVKVLRTDGATFDAARVVAEVRAAAKVVHPNIVTVYDAGEASGAPFLVMELLSGTSLRARIAADDAPTETRVYWANALAGALAAIHAEGLVHRDVKPENVLITGDGALKLLDFGLARALPSIDRAAITQTLGPVLALANDPISPGEMAVFGTPAYMAPEQLRGGVIDGRVDQFAWGIVVYELFTGERPWPGPDTITLVAANLESPAPPSRPGGAALPAPFDDVVHRALEKDPRDRFRSMNDVLAELHSPRVADAPRRGTSLGTVAFAAVAIAMGALSVTSHERDRGATPRTIKNARIATSVHSGAVAGYADALRLLREGSFTEGVAMLQQVTTLDRLLAPAHLRASIWSTEPDARARLHLQNARELRSSLSPIDRRILHAFEPWGAMTPDAVETDRRLRLLSTLEPENAEIHLLTGWNHYRAHNLIAAIEEYERSFAIDPGNALTLNLEGLALSYLNRVSDAQRVYRQCLELSPAATSCIRARALVTRGEGRCAETEDLGRRLVNLAPSSYQGYAILAEALYSRGDPVHARAAALRAAEVRADTKMAAHDILTRADAVVGDFDTAIAHAREWERSVENEPDEWAHLWPRLYQILLASEIGDTAAAQRLAHDYFARRTAWMVDDGWWSASIYVYDFLYRQNWITKSSFAVEREKWLAEMRGRRLSGRKPLGMLWITAYAQSVVTKQDAVEAFEALRNFDELPAAFNLTTDDRLGLADARRLSGDLDGGITDLEANVRACSAFDRPLHTVWSRLHLGLAYEQKGDRGRACSAFESVVSQWGAARPRSVTAEMARAHERSLACGNTNDRRQR